MQNPISAQSLARGIPARDLPVPTTVSLELQALIGAPLRTGWNAIPTRPEGWKALAEAGLAAARPNVAAMAARLGVTIAPGKMRHNFSDDTWGSVAHDFGLLRLLEDVIVEHRHHSFDKGVSAGGDSSSISTPSAVNFGGGRSSRG
jgi:hypothetical protein